MVRTALETATTFVKMKSLLDHALTDNDILMSSLVTGEVGKFDIPAIVNTLQRAVDHAFLLDIQQVPWAGFLKDTRANCQ